MRLALCLACRDIARVPVSSPYSQFSRGGSQKFGVRIRRHAVLNLRNITLEICCKSTIFRSPYYSLFLRSANSQRFLSHFNTKSNIELIVSFSLRLELGLNKKCRTEHRTEKNQLVTQYLSCKILLHRIALALNAVLSVT